MHMPRLSFSSKPLPNLKPVHGQHPTLNFFMGFTCKTQARKKLETRKSTTLMSNRSAKLEKDVYWMWGQEGTRNCLLNICSVRERICQSLKVRQG